jgi:hypothetical protein
MNFERVEIDEDSKNFIQEEINDKESERVFSPETSLAADE